MQDEASPEHQVRVRRFATLFQGSPRGHGSYTVVANGHGQSTGQKVEAPQNQRFTVKEPANMSHFLRHLEGSYGLGAVPLLLDPEACTYWAAIDIDDYSLDVPEFARMAAARGLPGIVCRTKSGGIHFYVFFSQPVETAAVRRKLAEWAAAIGYRDAEIFPKQDRLDDIRVVDCELCEGKPGNKKCLNCAGSGRVTVIDYGNWINLPYQSGARSTRYGLGPDGVALTLDEFLDAAERARLSRAELDACPTLLPPPGSPKAKPGPGPGRPKKPPMGGGTLSETRAFGRLQNALYDIRTCGDGGRNIELFKGACVWAELGKIAGISVADAQRAIHDAIKGQDTPLTFGEANQTISSAFKKVGRGGPKPQYDGEPLDVDAIMTAAKEGRATLDPVSELMEEFNGKFAVVNEGGKIGVYQAKYDLVLNRNYHEIQIFDDFHRAYMNRLVCVGVTENGKPIMKGVDAVWLHHRDRRQYLEGIVFDPSRLDAPEGQLNLWTGLAIKPEPGSWSLLREHMLMNLCEGKQELFDKLFGWCARMMQKPGEQAEMAVVFKGAQGTGKGIFVNALIRLLGQSAFRISDKRHLTGRFNSHLRDCVLLFADEAFYAGDKETVGILKGIITDDLLTIEGKYKSVVLSRNYLHLIMASNEKWVVPAELDARRFFILNVGSERRNDHAYFKAIQDELKNGGYEALMHDLLMFDLVNYNHRAVIQTIGLSEQQALSLPPEEMWWKDVLYRGYVFKSKLGLEDFFSEWQDWVSTDVLYDSYEAHPISRKIYRMMGRVEFGEFINKVAQRWGRKRNGVVGEHLTEVNEGQFNSRKAMLRKKKQATGYYFGDLQAARARFTADRMTIAWPFEGDDEPSAEPEIVVEEDIPF